MYRHCEIDLVRTYAMIVRKLEFIVGSALLTASMLIQVLYLDVGVWIHSNGSKEMISANATFLRQAMKHLVISAMYIC